MSDNDNFSQTTEELIGRYLLFLRGRGPEPDTSGLPFDRRAKLAEQFEIIAALADRDEELPPLEQDRVARRLGIVGPIAGAAVSLDVPELDLVRTALQELLSRFGRLVTVDFAPPWTAETPAGLRPAAQFAVLGDSVAVFVATVDEWARETAAIAVFFRRHPGVSAVALVSSDAAHAVVITAAEDPVQGSASAPEPLISVLGQYFDRYLPRWERVAALGELLGLSGLHADAVTISETQIAEARRARPRPAHQQEALEALRSLDPSTIAEVIADGRAGRLAGAALITRLADIAESIAP